MSLTPDQFRKTAMGGLIPSPSPFLTPRPERRRPDSRGTDWLSNRQDRDKEVNVQVLLRCRPLSEDEQRTNVPRVISCNELKREVTVLQNVANKQVDRVFTFDKVFGPKSQQRTIYDQAIAPIVNEVLDGFNCTVFAYGQTGTGKTYTMEGGMRNMGGDLPAEAGVIPRAVRQIFDTLEAQNADYSMKVTFLELYNEEITDLLAPDESPRYAEDRQRKPISLMEDGKGSVIMRGLEEEAVYSANEIYTILERGAAKRRTADTLLNKRSSRSHSVFSITIHIKETAVGDEEMIKCGKLNLVDLAGSENISRSGAREGRAREAGEINKSLLTLGRVISALVEHSAHIPYRDSKLTRLLRDSLGGKTKTCIIATISPSSHSLEETLSTLDYAYRAKNIKNRPEANQKMSKAVLLKDLYLEIEKKKEDVRAARDKNGVYIPHERFLQEEAEKKARMEKIEQLENDLNLSEKQAKNYHELYLTEQDQRFDLESDLKDCKINIEKNRKELLNLQENHRVAIQTLKEKEFIISKLLCSENSLIERAKELRTDLQHASEDINSLFTKLDDKDKMEAENRSIVLTFGSQLNQHLQDLHKTILGSVSLQQQQLRSMEEHAHSFIASKCDATKALESKVQSMTETYASGVATMKELANKIQRNASSDMEEMHFSFSSQIEAIEKFLVTVVMEAKEVLEDLQNSLNEQKELLVSAARQQEEGLHRNLISAQEISKATFHFLTDINNQTSKFMTTLEEIETKKSLQITNFENRFKEEAASEETQAMEKIAAILATLTSNRNAMVSEASGRMKDSNIQDNKILQRKMSMLQQVSADVGKEMCKYIKKVETHFVEDSFSAAESASIMEDGLQECSKRVNVSRQQWENAKTCINELNASSLAEVKSSVSVNIRRNNAAHEELLSVISLTDAEFGTRTGDIVAAINDSQLHDHECKKKIDSVTNSCVDQLKTVQEKHGESISYIRSEAEKCLTKDYLADQHTKPKKRDIVVPSLVSIEGMRTPTAFEDDEGEENNLEKNRSKWGNNESKIQQHVTSLSPNRTPFTDVN
ncbi:kinesin-like protein KIN-5B isoform X2 [Hibiscus syriacus]|uniref:kinesin-like protein KIN-5B isoform X2 n=1 Tax=Hibiscus syriacus TaxID=106335 RepID=UPI001922DEDE|nr:kinesin-like protein KIN-5B isoform X2 [Hibiscus syriacus]